jgi:hypothetical protein
MLKRLLLTLLFVVGTAICFAQAADQSSSRGQHQDSVGTPDRIIVGTISTIDHTYDTVTIKDDATKETERFTLPAKVSISKAGSSMKSNQLKKGDHVSVEVDPHNIIQKVVMIQKVVVVPETSDTSGKY